MKLNQLKEAAREMGYEVVERETTVYFKSSHATYVAFLKDGKFLKGSRPNAIIAQMSPRYTTIKKLHAALEASWRSSQEVAK